ncbi:MAG: hypothetical protein J6I65_03375 [Lachnospiraceae bacterium]|nr:hypothetical protein [Lachnospiraceae bacterium]
MTDYKKLGKKICAYAVCVAMTVSLAGCGANSEAPGSVSAEEKQMEKKLTETVSEAAKFKSGSGEFDKEETVYLLADANGKVKETIVSEWLKNKERTESLEDTSELTEIKNVKGEESFSQNGTDLTWQANGADIYYQGNSEKKAPVSVQATYFLDGEEMSAEEIAGKIGKVKMRFTYENTEKNGEVYTPFMLVTGMILEDDTFSNIEVENGKVISDGKNNIVVGYGFPGLQESLDLNIGDKELDVDIPSSFEVTADAKDFSLDMTMTIATSDMFQEIDTEDMDFGEIFDKLDSKLSEFEDGSQELSDGIKEYTDNVAKIAKATKQLESGSKTLTKGTESLEKGVDSVKKGTVSLDNGAQELKNGIASAKTGADQLKAGYAGDNGAAAGAKALKEGLETLNKAVAGLTFPTAVVPELTQEQLQQLQAQITAVLQKEIPTAVTGYAAKDPQIASDPAMQAAFSYAYQQAYVKAYQEGMQAGAKAAVDRINATVGGMSGQIGTLKSSVSALSTGASQLSAGIDKLKAGTNSLAEGLGKLKSGSETLAGGTKTLKSGSAKLGSGAKKLSKGAITLKKGTGKLSSGAGKLDRASDDLLAGTKKLLKGVTTITEKADDYETDLSGITDRAKELVEAGKAYKSFAGARDDVKASCKFIIKTDKVGK